MISSTLKEDKRDKELELGVKVYSSKKICCYYENFQKNRRSCQQTFIFKII